MLLRLVLKDDRVTIWNNDESIAIVHIDDLENAEPPHSNSDVCDVLREHKDITVKLTVDSL